MAAENTQISSKFPEDDFGDFGIQSSDGVICYFPSALLGLMSPVFRDMFSLGEGREQKVINKPTVQIAEPLSTLELFLTQLNPITDESRIDKDNIEALLQMAHKYQTEPVLRWFDREATSQRLMESTQPFVITDPILCLSLAVSYDLQNCGRCALRELCSFNHKYLLEGSRRLGIHTFLHLMDLREQRIKRYEGWIDVLTRVRPEDDDSFWEQKVASGPQYWVKNGWKAACLTCIAQRSQWLTELSRAINIQPSWSIFIHNYRRNSTHCFSWSDYFDYLLDGWREEALREETKFPDWPIPN